MITYRAYRDADCNSLLETWEAALPLDAITRPEFEQRVLLDVNREAESLIVAADEATGRVAGFILCLVLRRPIENTGLLENRGFITVFAVHPEWQRRGIGGELLSRAEQFLRARGRKETVLAPYTPNYFVPGVDKERYAAGLSFLTKRGFVEFSEAIAMDAPIGKFELSDAVAAKEKSLAAEGVVIQSFKRSRMVEYLDFMGREMPGPWLEDARRNLVELTHGRFSEDAILLACDGDRIVGYCQFEGEHFGPFGIIESHQSRGIGGVLLARTLHRMRVKGIHSAFVLWTGDRAAKGVYGRLGFTVSRRFAVLKKTLVA